MSQADNGFAYSRGYGKTDNTPHQRWTADFASFREAIVSDRATDRGQQWISGPCDVAQDDNAHRAEASKAAAIGLPHRCKACALPRHWIGLDIDGGTADRPGLNAESFANLVQVLQRNSGLLYTTASHTEAAPRCRVILELDSALPRAELIHVTKVVRERLDAEMVAAGYQPLPWDSACDKPEQPLYLPLETAKSYFTDGRPLVVGELLAHIEPRGPSQTQESARVALATGTDAYAAGALESALRAIRDAPEGSRNKVVNREAFALGGFIGQGRLPRESVESQLMAATREAGWEDPAKTEATIRSAAAAGTQHPRTDGLASPALMTLATGHAEVECEDKLTPVSLAGLQTATLRPTRFVLKPIVPRGVVTLLGGHGGTGKSSVALTMSAHVADGRSWAGFLCDGPQRVVFVSLEDPGEVVLYRLRATVEMYGLNWEQIERNLLVLDGADIDAALVREYTEFGSRSVRPTARMAEMQAAVAGTDLIIIDNASDAYDGDENNRRQVRSFVRPLGQIARNNDAGLILLVHVDKNAVRNGAHGNSYSGSTAWHNSARSRLAMITAGPYVELLHEKANLSALAGKVTLEWQGPGVLVPVAVESETQQQSSREQIQADADAVLLVLGIAADVGAVVPSATKGPSTAMRALEQFPELARVYRDKAGHRRVEAALVQLIRDKRIARAVVKTSSRNTREVFELTQAGMAALNAMRASIPHTPSVTDARAWERASVGTDHAENLTNATDATDALGTFVFSPYSPNPPAAGGQAQDGSSP